MEDEIHGGDEPFQQGLVQDGVVDEVEGGKPQEVPDVFNPSGGEVIEDQDLVAALDQGVNEMRADVPGAACDEDPHARPPFSAIRLV